MELTKQETAMARGQHQHLLAIMVAGIAPKGHGATPQDAASVVDTAIVYLNAVSAHVDRMLPMPEDDDDQADAI